MLKFKEGDKVIVTDIDLSCNERHVAVIDAVFRMESLKGYGIELTEDNHHKERRHFVGPHSIVDVVNIDLNSNWWRLWQVDEYTSS